MSHETKLGTIPTGIEGRDAVHVAIVPACAAQVLDCGEAVKFDARGQAVFSRAEEAIGVVDPFRMHEDRIVAKGAWFWLCLYPKTITGLRHVWDHPAFPVGEALAPAVAAPLPDKGESERWLMAYVKQHCPYADDEGDFGYAAFLSRVKHDRGIHYHGSDCHSLSDVEDADELFRHLSILLDQRVDAEYFSTFTCSC